MQHHTITEGQQHRTPPPPVTFPIARTPIPIANDPPKLLHPPFQRPTNFCLLRDVISKQRNQQTRSCRIFTPQHRSTPQPQRPRRLIFPRNFCPTSQPSKKPNSPRGNSLGSGQLPQPHYLRNPRPARCAQHLRNLRNLHRLGSNPLPE